jgi:Flp pilus assembly protein TadB
MNKLVRFLTALAATSAMFLAPAAMAATHHHHHHHKAKTHKVATHHAAAAKSPAHKPAASHARTAQQQKMAQCAHQSKGLKGKAHTEFMSKCLKK